MKRSFFLLLIIFPHCSYAMELGNRIDPVGLAIGKTNASANINQNYVPYNQAVAALCEFPIIQTTYTNSFFLPSLGRGQLGLVYPCKFGTWCAKIHIMNYFCQENK